MNTISTEFSLLKRFALFFLLCLLIKPVTGYSQQQNLDIVVVLDNSGSMKDNDENDLRYQAARMLIDLLAEQDRIGFVTFADDAQLITPSLQLISSPDEGGNLKELVQGASSEDGETNYTRALNTTFQLLGEDRGNKQVVFFLTDGEPTREEAGISVALGQFLQADIPIYLMLLSTEGRSEINSLFQQTGPMPISIASAPDIGNAFAFALSNLRPTTYLDQLHGSPGTGNSTRFRADAGPLQKIFGISFVFLSTVPATSINVDLIATPDNAQLRNQPNDKDYAVFSFRSNDTLPLNGQWLFDVITSNVTAFAFIYSDIELQLAIPSDLGLSYVPAILSNEPFVLGATASGGDVGNALIEARVQLAESCFATIGSTQNGDLYELQPTGLSANNTLFWRELDINLNQPTAINLELGQLDQPVRLSRCFFLQPIEVATNLLQIRRPTGNDPITNNGIPLGLELSPDVEWQTVQAYILDPSGQVFQIDLQSDPNKQEWNGGFNSITVSGSYIIRFLAHGIINNQYALSTFSETIYEAKGTVNPNNSNYDLGEITSLDQSFDTIVSLLVALASSETNINLETINVRYSDTEQDVSADVDIDIQPCQVEGQNSNCRVRITPSNNLPPGRYEVNIQVVSLGIEVPQDRIIFTFIRPQSSITLNNVGPDSQLALGVATPVQPILRKTINFTATLWRGNPNISEGLHVLKLLDIETRKEYPTSLVVTELDQIGSADLLQYELVLQIMPELPAGNYQMTVGLNSTNPNLMVMPTPLTLSFTKIEAYAVAEFGDGLIEMNRPVWGLPIISPILGQTSYLTVPIRTFYMVAPPLLPSPEVIQIKKSASDITFDDLSRLRFSWRNDGLVEGQPELYRMTLIGEIIGPMPVGIYDVRLAMQPPLMEPTEEVVQLQVWGWQAFWLLRFLPFMVLVALVWGGVRYTIITVRPSFTGTLDVRGQSFPLRGRKPLQLVGNKRTRRLELQRLDQPLRPPEQVSVMKIYLIRHRMIRLDIPSKRRTRQLELKLNQQPNDRRLKNAIRYRR